MDAKLPTLVVLNLPVDVFLLETAIVNFLKLFFILGEGTEIFFIFFDNFFNVGQTLGVSVLEGVRCFEEILGIGFMLDKHNMLSLCCCSLSQPRQRNNQH